MPSDPDSVVEKDSTVPRVPSASEELSRFSRPSLPEESNRPTTAPPAALRAPRQHQDLLELAGPHAFVNEGYLAAFFRFASYRCHAALARKAIERAHRGGGIAGVQLTEDESIPWFEVAAYWDRDPCE
ncbi:hypothetical protein DL764_008168 [Monosporascus ibericus]|uniref:Uncharacterized protein n=1 Tax=Monosporascus ibericus TaxID=155417 RepID=A0A4Q4T1I4_9PEZI|nr:hypothetical protein DL764_008168 [Monosporascus ibericus]